MCAAPGMKTTHLAAQIRNKGKIYAVERDERRFKTLSEYVDGTKSACVSAIHLDALLLGANIANVFNSPCHFSVFNPFFHFAEDDFVPNVEYILVDPSCSGSGMTNRLFVSTEKDPDRLANLTGLQSRMLSHAMRAFTKAKKIVYSTCSIHPEENEKVVNECLEMCPDWKLIKPLEFAEKWKHFGSPKFKHVGKKCIYAKSDIDLTDGFFVAVFEREIDPTKPIEPYSRNEAVLERINHNLKRKYTTETTADLESRATDEAVIAVDDDLNGSATEGGKKKKKKQKEETSVENSVQQIVESIQEPHVDAPLAKKSKKKKKNDLDVERVHERDIEGNFVGEANKKEKRKMFDEETAASTPIEDKSASSGEKLKKKKKKKRDDESETVSSDKVNESTTVPADVIDVAVSEAEQTKKKKKKSKNK